MKRSVIAASAAALIGLSTIACSQPYGGMGPGMMGGYGPGPNQEQGRGPGYGPGGYGPGYGPGGYGPGYGMGPGMMGGYGYGMGPGMMGGYGPGLGYGYGPKLSDEQRSKIADIQQEIGAKRWGLMEKMQEQGGPMWRAYGPGPIDEKAARKSYDEMAAVQKQMFELQLEARKRIDAVLTPEQREQVYRGWGKR